MNELIEERSRRWLIRIAMYTAEKSAFESIKNTRLSNLQIFHKLMFEQIPWYHFSVRKAFVLNYKFIYESLTRLNFPTFEEYFSLNTPRSSTLKNFERFPFA
jgi:hypothetical protein